MCEHCLPLTPTSLVVTKEAFRLIDGLSENGRIIYTRAKYSIGQRPSSIACFCLGRYIWIHAQITTPVAR